MNDKKMVSFRTTEISKNAFFAVLNVRFETLAGLGNLLIDAFCKDPEETIKALTKIKNK